MSEVSKEQLLDDVRDVLNNTEELIAQTSENGSDKARALRDKLTANLEVAKDRLLRAEEAVTAKAKVACKTTDQYAHDHPHGVAAQQYLPDELVDARYYVPTDHGAEAGMAERMATLDDLLGRPAT